MRDKPESRYPALGSACHKAHSATSGPAVALPKLAGKPAKLAKTKSCSMVGCKTETMIGPLTFLRYLDPSTVTNFRARLLFAGRPSSRFRLQSKLLLCAEVPLHEKNKKPSALKKARKARKTSETRSSSLAVFYVEQVALNRHAQVVNYHPRSKPTAPKVSSTQAGAKWN
jgi:hypothetical protein